MHMNQKADTKNMFHMHEPLIRMDLENVWLCIPAKACVGV